MAWKTMTLGRNCDVVIYPEVAASALRHKLHAVYAVYAVVKAIDITQSGRGLMSLSDLLNVTKDTLGISTSQAYRVIKMGTGIFWRSPVKNIIGLYSHGKAYYRLGIDMYSSQPVKLLAHQLGYKSGVYNGSYIKDIMVGTVAAWDNGGSPLSIEAITQLTGISERTIQRHLGYAASDNRHGIVLKVMAAHRVMCDNLTQSEANTKCIVLNSNMGVKYRTEAKNGMFAVIVRTGNVYSLAGVERLGKRKRHRQLKGLTPNTKGNYVSTR